MEPMNQMRKRASAASSIPARHATPTRTPGSSGPSEAYAKYPPRRRAVEGISRRPSAPRSSTVVACSAASSAPDSAPFSSSQPGTRASTARLSSSTCTRHRADESPFGRGATVTARTSGSVLTNAANDASVHSGSCSARSRTPSTCSRMRRRTSAAASVAFACSASRPSV